MVKKESIIKRIYSEHKGEKFIKKSEAWTVVFFGRVFGTPLARLFAWLKVKPNHITVFTIPLSFIAGYFFYNNQLVLGALFYFLGYILDCSDGTLARMTNQTSRFGQRLDYYSDIINNIPMYFGLWYSQFYLNDMWFIGGAIIAIHYVIIFSGYLFINDLTYKTISPKISSYYMPEDEGFLTFAIAPLTGYFYLVFPTLVIIQLFSYTILFIRQKEKPDFKKNIKTIFKT